MSGFGTVGGAGVGGVAIEVQDEGVQLPLRPSINFLGNGVDAVDNPAQDRTDVTIPGVAGGSPYATIQDEGSALTARAALDFRGAGVTVTDDGAGSRTRVTIPGPGTAANAPFVYNVLTDYGAVGDGVTDDTTAIQNAINAANAAGGGVVHFPPHDYLCLSLALKSGVHLVGYGARLIKNAGGVGTCVVDANGTTSTAIPASANIARGDTVLNVASSTGIVAGDYVLVRDVSYKYSTQGRNQELNRVLSVTGTTITVAMRTISTYTTANTAEVVKLNTVSRASIEGLDIVINPGTSGGGIQTTLSYGVKAIRCRITGAKETGGIRFSQSAYCRAHDCIVRDGQSTNTSGLGYGIAFYDSSHHCLADLNHVENMRECPVSNNTRYSSFVNNTVMGNYDDGINTHGSGNEHILIANNLIWGCRGLGINIGFSGSAAFDTDITARGNTIGCTGSHGIYSIGKDSSNKSQRIQIVDNEIADWGQTAGSTNAILLQNVTDATVRGNYARNSTGATAAGINIGTGVSWVQIQNNVVQDLTTSGADGIKIANDASRISITGNHLKNIADQNIEVPVGCTKVVVDANQTDDATNTLTGATVVGSSNIFG